MRRVLSYIAALSLICTMTCGIHAASFDPEVNYMSIMISAAARGDLAAGLQAEQLRNQKIQELGLEGEFTQISYWELNLLSKIIYAEAGSDWLSDEWKMSVGEVVLNRVNSPEFPNTIEDVLDQPGQYYGRGSSYFARLLPSERCVVLAMRLLEGERHLMNPAVVFQANFTQGSGVHLAYYDSYLGWTYFCYSSRPALYFV